MQKTKKEQGITLLVLVITIIILLILAGITIRAITGDNGIIRNAGQAKEETEIANEKEIIEKATVQAMENNKYGNIEESELQEQLDKETKEGKTEVADVGNEFEVVFNESNRYYTVDKEGHVEGAYEIVEDKYPGDITVGKDGNTLDGSEEKPYEIWCIEDLCAFSNEVNKGNPLIYKYVKLMRDLNFNSDLSYENGKILVDGNIKSCQSIEELKKLLTKNEGFYPIGNSYLSTTNSNFRGTFDGNHKTIKNIYINRPNSVVGLFGATSNDTDYNIIIKNLSISGNMTGSTVGSIFADVRTYDRDNKGSFIKIENCTSNVNIEGDVAGGIIGINNASSEGNLIIVNCTNKGKISGKSKVAGILGHNYNSAKIINCYNLGGISGDADVGGIIGHDGRASNTINTYNLGNIKSNSNAGGIIGFSGWAEKSIENCYNIGKISGSTVGGIIGGLNISNDLLTTQNCYYLNTDISKGIGGWNTSAEALEDIQGLTDSEMKSSEILEKLNNYVIENEIREGIELKKWIKGGDEGYPIFS